MIKKGVTKKDQVGRLGRPPEVCGFPRLRMVSKGVAQGRNFWA